jgi:hypothetical protein
MSAIVVGRPKAAYGATAAGVGALGHHGRTAVVGDTDEEEMDAPSSFVPYDVLCGRSTIAQSSVGNRRFRITVALVLPRYLSAPTRVGRTAAIESVVASIQESGGRFLRRQNSRWIELDDKQAREKVGHALREVASTSSSSSSWVTSTDDGASHRVVHSQPFLLNHGGGDPSLSPPTALHNLASTWKKKASPWPSSRGWKHGGPGSSSIRALDARKSGQHGYFLLPGTRSGCGRRSRLNDDDDLLDVEAVDGWKRRRESPPSASGVLVGAAESDVVQLIN